MKTTNRLPSIEHSFIAGRDVREVTCPDGMAQDAFERTLCNNVKDLRKYGLVFDAKDVEVMAHWAMDAIQENVTVPSIVTPVQFLQQWLPGFVKVITAARKIDEIVGISTTGSWEDEEVVQGILENTGQAVPYGDYTNTVLASWNTNFVVRNVVRLELGMKVTRLDEQRAARIRVSDSQSKRESCALQLDIERNLIGFNGFNNGNNLTYGFLNDPSLPAYQNVVASGSGSSTLWANKDYLEIVQDLIVAFADLQTKSQDTINPETTECTLALATTDYQYLSTVSQFGNSVKQWLNATYPKCRIVSAPQLNGANGGANVFVIFADKVNDLSTDDQRAFIQVVPAKFQVLGVSQQTKGYEEAYSNATAGVMCKRPYAVTRWSGI